MSENVELLDLDLRYEGHRLQDRAREARLLASIAARGVETPLEGVDTPEGRILLQGFKRWRCARKLQLASVPYVSLAQDQALGILALMGASLLYLRYSKLRYLKFYRVFTRFIMKCFLHEGLTFWDHAAPWCIIDNTNLARLRGSGRRAILVPEMVAFAEQYGFQFVCHEIRHANRKAGEERSFRTVETNFLPGRTFESLEDLNRQAFEWATVRMEQRVVPKTGLIPARAFEEERPYLTKLTPHLPPP